jgi:hypothetical protein
VAIVGGGAAGTYAAVRLADLGNTTIVIEKNAYLGGATYTYTDNGTGMPVNLGVQFLQDTPKVRNYVEKLGVYLFPAILSSNATRISVDFQTGKAVPEHQFPSPSAVMAGMRAYAQVYTTRFPYLNYGYYLTDPVPHDLLGTFGDFLNKYNLSTIAPIIDLFNQPDSAARDTALYPIAFTNLDFVHAFGKGLVTTRDMGLLYRNAKRYLNKNENTMLLFDGKIASVQRGSDEVHLTLETPHGIKKICAKKLLMTGAPLLKNLQGWDLSATEKDLFSKFRSRGHYCGVFRNPGLDPSIQFVNVATSNGSMGVGDLPGPFQFYPAPMIPGAFFMCYGTKRHMSAERAKKLFEGQLGRMRDNKIIGQGETEWLVWHDFSPNGLRVTPENIREGFYRKLYALQGQRLTWWSGAAWTSQDSASVWQFTNGVLDSMKGG